MSSSLVLLIEKSQLLERKLIENGGELSPEDEAALLTIEVNLPDRVDAYYYVSEDLEARAEIWKKRAQELTRIAKALVSTAEKIKDGVKYAMREHALTDLKGSNRRFKLSCSKDAKLVCVDETKTPEHYKMQVVTYTWDKERIEKNLREGFPVDGWELQDVYRLNNYVNKGE